MEEEVHISRRLVAYVNVHVVERKSCVEPQTLDD